MNAIEFFVMYVIPCELGAIIGLLIAVIGWQKDIYKKLRDKK